MLLKLIEKDNGIDDVNNQHISGIGSSTSRQQRDQVNDILENALHKGAAVKSSGSKKKKTITALRKKQKDGQCLFEYIIHCILS